jgi:predicted nucleic acid-binding protein
VIAVDAGLLAYALNRYPPEHTRAARLLEELAHGDRPWAIPAPAIPEFLRAVAHPHGVARPLALDDALGFLEALLEAPAAHLLSPGPGHLTALREASAMAPAEALVSRLAVAAVLREHGVREILTTDRMLRRFPFLTAIDPLRDPAWTPQSRPERRYRVLGSRRPR